MDSKELSAEESSGNSPPKSTSTGSTGVTASASTSRSTLGNSTPKSTSTGSTGVTASASTSRSIYWRDIATQVAPSTMEAAASCSTGNVGATTAGNYRETARQIRDVLSAMEARLPALVRKPSKHKHHKVSKEEEGVQPNKANASVPASTPSLNVDSDLEFVYADTDKHHVEIAEWYIHSERSEFQLNYMAFKTQMREFKMSKIWRRQNADQRKSVIMKLLDQLEVTDKQLRMRGARCILYIAQGCWKEVKTEAEQREYEKLNVMLLYQLAVFDAFIVLLDIEIHNLGDCPECMEDTTDLRVILSVLYIMTEVMRQEGDSDSSQYQRYVNSFETDLANPLGGELLTVKLFKMIETFGRGDAPNYPIKKVLLLLWKLILISLGGMSTLKHMKIEKRLKAGLPILLEDTIEIAGHLKSSTPPPNFAGRLKSSTRSAVTPDFVEKLSKIFSKGDTKPSSQNSKKESSNGNYDAVKMEIEPSVNANDDLIEHLDKYAKGHTCIDNPVVGGTSRAGSFTLRSSEELNKTFPWKTKARQSDLDSFLKAAREKYIGDTLPGDQDSLFELPSHIKENVEILKQNIYTSLGEVEIEKETEISRNYMARNFQEEIEMTPTEVLYRALWPNLSKYIKALLEIFIAASPLSRSRSHPFNILANVFADPMPSSEIEKIRLKTDCNRHKEVILKAISAILLLLLKHFKLNHIYQFEFLSDHLVSMDCIPLFIRFFEQGEIMDFVRPKNVIQLLDFPLFVIGNPHEFEFSAASLEITDSAPLSWRNMFTCINQLRILNKLTKWKKSRILTLVKLKSASPLTRTLSIRHPITQLYALKLIKMQSRFLGRQWRGKNMKIVNAIYQKVRHRIADDWAYGNDVKVKVSASEEKALRASVELFNKRRYTQDNNQTEFLNRYSTTGVLAEPHDLPDSFIQNYEQWLEQEVFGDPMEWGVLLNDDV